MIRIQQIKCRPGHPEGQLRKKAAELLRVREDDILSFSVVRRSVDARKKPDIFYSYTVDVKVRREEAVCRRLKGNGAARLEPVEYRFPEKGKQALKERPVIIGAGPAGLFCGYYLALHGYRPLILERGADVERRIRDVEEFWHGGALKPDSNVQFGEGGAGTFSDGKLNTLVKDRDGRNREVLRTFVRFGAGEEILYEAKPHIGTDVLCGIVKRMREEICRLGGAVRFDSRVTELKTEAGRVTGIVVNEREHIACSQVILAIGHSARDTFDMLYQKGVPMEAKSFAVGLRVEHLQSMINQSQYGLPEPGPLGAAPYKVTARTGCGRGVYSFCMCPGGYVVNASSEPGRLAVNGMSYSGRDGNNANSAVIVSVTPEDFGSSHPLAGVAFQRGLEERAWAAGKGRIPVQRYGVFRRCVESGRTEAELTEEERRVAIGNGPEPAIRGAYTYGDVSGILPRELNLAFVEGMERFGRQIPGFDREDALLSGVESRTSSPVRIPREEDFQSPVKGLYPCGEGAGYAGGIMSAAMDGIRAAEAVAARFSPEGLH